VDRGEERVDSSDQDLRVAFLVLHLGPEGVGAVGAEIFVFVPLGQDQEQALPDRNRSAAAGTVKLAGFKLIEGRRGFPW
jgi:hypothetical protein